MKKAIAVILAVLLAFSLFACNKGIVSTSAASSPASTTAAPSASATAASPSASAIAASPSASAIAVSPSATARTSTVKIFDPTEDYTKNPKFKVVYMEYATLTNGNAFSAGLKHWASVTNCDFQEYSANFDDDVYVNALQTFADQGVKGFILDPNPAIYERLAELCTELKVSFTAGLGAVVDLKGNLLAPGAGYNNLACGFDIANWMMDYAKKTWNVTDFKNVGYISLDFSISAAIHDRTVGAKNAWLKANPDLEKNFFVGDGLTTMKLDDQTAFDICAATMSAHTEFTHWLISACVDDFANGASRAAESLNKQDTTVVTEIAGGSSLISQLDLGQTSCWKASITCDELYNSEFVYFGLYAMMNGTRPEALWPEWIDHSTSQKYAYLSIPTVFITKENYKDYKAWIGKITGTNDSKYSYNGVDFPQMLTPPASFAG